MLIIHILLQRHDLQQFQLLHFISVLTSLRETVFLSILEERNLS